MVTDSSPLSLQVNLSPNLSSNHTPKNRVMYEQVNHHTRGSCSVVNVMSEDTSAWLLFQVIFNLLSLVGLARAVEGNMRYK